MTATPLTINEVKANVKQNEANIVRDKTTSCAFLLGQGLKTIFC